MTKEEESRYTLGSCLRRHRWVTSSPNLLSFLLVPGSPGEATCSTLLKKAKAGQLTISPTKYRGSSPSFGFQSTSTKSSRSKAGSCVDARKGIFAYGDS